MISFRRTSDKIKPHCKPQERLKRFAKQCKPQRWRALARGLVDECEKRAKYVEQERAKRELAPTDAIAFEGLKPPGEPDAAERLRAFLEAKARRAGLAVAPAPTKEEVARAAARAGAARQGGRRDEESEEDDEEEVVAAATKLQQKGKKGAKAASVKGGGGLEAAESVERLEDEVGELGEWSDSDGMEDGGMDVEDDDDEDDDEEDSEDEDEESE